MKMSEIKMMTETELQDSLRSERDNALKLRMTHTISTLENPSDLKKSRVKIARLLTEINFRKNA
jgi:large subunit ribosomal protein L29